VAREKRNVIRMGSKQGDLQHFESIPWCAALLQDPAFEIAPTTSRQPKESTEDAFFAETLNTQNTISACLTMRRLPVGNPPRINEIRTFLQLGPLLNGWPNVCHGGAVCTILDEIMGTLLSLNKDLKESEERDKIVTAGLNISFLKPVRTPSAIMVTAKFKETYGRKHTIEASIEEDATILARADSLWITVDKSKEQKL
jgi:acyl-coenzyme A thioesterase PaaI-like protein